MQRFHPPFYPLLYPYPPSLAPPPWIFASSFIPFPAILCVHVGEAWPAINSRGHRRNYDEKRDEEEEEEERTSKGWLYYPEGNFVPPRDCWVIVVRSVWPMLHLLTRIIVKEEKKKRWRQRGSSNRCFVDLFASHLWNVGKINFLFLRTPYFSCLLRENEEKMVVDFENLGIFCNLIWKI